MTQPEAGVRLTSDAGVATLEIDCPPLNVLDIQTLEEVLGAIGSLSADETKVLVLRGREGAFSAGLDVREYAGSSFTDLIDRFHGIFRRLVSVDFPVVAVVDGYCLGAGLELVSVCDFTIASDDSVLGQPEIGLGLFPPVATIVLPRLIGIAPANELILTGRRVSAAEAWDMGLIWRSVAREDLEQEAQNLISSLTRVPVAREYCGWSTGVRRVPRP